MVPLPRPRRHPSDAAALLREFVTPDRRNRFAKADGSITVSEKKLSLYPSHLHRPLFRTEFPQGLS
jgi:hypothetical protein